MSVTPGSETPRVRDAKPYLPGGFFRTLLQANVDQDV